MECSRCGAKYSLLEAECPKCGKKTLGLLESDSKDPGGPRLGEYGDSQLRHDGEGVPQGGLETAPFEKEVRQISEFVFHSPHVQGNGLYKKRADSTSFIYEMESNEVNAIAMERPVAENVPPTSIVLYAGLARAAKVLSAGLAACFSMEEKVPFRSAVPLFKAVGHPIMMNGEFSQADALQVIQKFDLEEKAKSKPFRSSMHSLRAAMIMSVISHEVGHIALGHTLGKATNEEVQRNMEREADSFASSIIATSPFADHLVSGAIFFFTLLAWTDVAAEVRTHPRSRERLFDYIRENEEQAENLGLNPSVAEALIPG